MGSQATGAQSTGSQATGSQATGGPSSGSVALGVSPVLLPNKKPIAVAPEPTIAARRTGISHGFDTR